MSATVDVWGWHARFRLARGQTISDLVTKIPAIESGLGTFRGAVPAGPTEAITLRYMRHGSNVWPPPGMHSRRSAHIRPRMSLCS